MRVGSHIFREPLLKWIQETGITQVEIAALCNVSQALVGKWINGGSQSMSKNSFDILSPYLNRYIEKETAIKAKKEEKLDSTIPDMIHRYFVNKKISPSQAIEKYNLSLSSLAVIYDGKNSGILTAEELNEMKELVIEVWNDLFKDETH